MIKKVVPTTESKIKQMRRFVNTHKGESFTATGLSKNLGWTRYKVRKIKDEDGKMVEETFSTSQNAKAAVRLAKKCGALVERTIRERIGKNGKNESIPVFTIVL